MNTTKRKMHRNRGPEILAFLAKHPGLPFTSLELCDQLGFPPEDRNRVTAAITHLRDANQPIESPVRGSYMYMANRKPKTEAIEKNDEIYERLGKLITGEVVVRGTDSELLYVLSPLRK